MHNFFQNFLRAFFRTKCQNSLTSTLDKFQGISLTYHLGQNHTRWSEWWSEIFFSGFCKWWIPDRNPEKNLDDYLKKYVYIAWHRNRGIFGGISEQYSGGIPGGYLNRFWFFLKNRFDFFLRILGRIIMIPRRNVLRIFGNISVRYFERIPWRVFWRIL